MPKARWLRFLLAVWPVLRFGATAQEIPFEHFADAQIHGAIRESHPFRYARELSWYISDEDRGLIAIETGRTEALVGFLKQSKKELRNVKAEVKNDSCGITLSSLDGKPLSQAATMLLTTGSQVQNTGSRWNERHTLFAEWGVPPTLIEPVTGWIVLRELEGAIALRATALDGSSRRIGEAIKGRRLEEGWEFAIGHPVTTSYLIEVIRGVG